jgi:site-specific DNA-methyltransferase (adenine-specific)
MTTAVQIGLATLYLGDALRIIPEWSGVGMVLTDPPYSSGGAFRGDRTVATSIKYQNAEQRGNFPEFSGDNKDQRGFTLWSAIWLGMLREVSLPGTICGVFSDWRQIPATTDAIQGGGWVWRGIVPWDKTQGRPQKGRYRAQCEYVIWGSNGPLPLNGPCAPGLFRQSVNSEKRHHIAAKPVALMKSLMQLAPTGATVADPFMGSGSTGVAAVELGLPFVGCEMDASSFDLACRRIALCQGLPWPPQAAVE